MHISTASALSATPCIENYYLWELLNAHGRAMQEGDFDRKCELDLAIAKQAERAGGVSRDYSHMSFRMPNGTRLYLTDQRGWVTTAAAAEAV